MAPGSPVDEEFLVRPGDLWRNEAAGGQTCLIYSPPDNLTMLPGTKSLVPLNTVLHLVLMVSSEARTVFVVCLHRSLSRCLSEKILRTSRCS